MTTTSTQAALGFVTCVDNSGYPASLVVGKSYRVLHEDNAEPDEIRVIDESGEDYLYPRDMFSTESEARVTGPADSTLYSDIEREALGFIEENEPLLEQGSPTVLGRIFVQGANITTALSEEAVTATNRAASVMRTLAEAIRNPATPAVRLQQLEEESARTKALQEHRGQIFQQFSDFMERVDGLRRQRAGEGGEE